MTRSESIGALAAALAKAQKAIKGAVKDAKNPHFNSRYADLATVHEACRDALADNGIAVVQSPSADAGLVRLTTLLMHSSGEWIESDALQVQAKDAGPQAVGSCLTYLRRYQLAAVVGVAPEDDDAEAAEGRAVSSQQAARPAPPRPMGPPPRTNPADQRHAQSRTQAPPRYVTKPEDAPDYPGPLSDKDIPF